MAMLCSHYKAEGQAKGPCCLLCQTRSEGVARAVHLAYGEYVYLCAGHASEEFRRQRGGRDFVHSIWRACQSAGQLSPRRRKALRWLTGQLSAFQNQPAAPAPVRARPGSYAHKTARRAVEDACRRGVVAIGTLREVAHAAIGKLALRSVEPPSPRTLRRWRAERRWALPGWEPPTRRVRV